MSESIQQACVQTQQARPGTHGAWAFALLLPLLAAGCSSAYKPALDGKPTARIRFVTDHPSSTHGIEATVVSYLPANCNAFRVSDPGMALTQRIALLTGNVSLGTPLFALQQPRDAMERQGMPGDVPKTDSLYSERKLPADERFSFAMSAMYRSSLSTVATCWVAGEFTPEAGSDYEAVYTKVGHGCGVRLTRLAAGGTVLPRPEAVPVKSLPQCQPAGATP